MAGPSEREDHIARVRSVYGSRPAAGQSSEARTGEQISDKCLQAVPFQDAGEPGETDRIIGELGSPRII